MVIDQTVGLSKRQVPCIYEMTCRQHAKRTLLVARELQNSIQNALPTCSTARMGHWLGATTVTIVHRGRYSVGPVFPPTSPCNDIPAHDSGTRGGCNLERDETRCFHVKHTMDSLDPMHRGKSSFLPVMWADDHAENRVSITDCLEFQNQNGNRPAGGGGWGGALGQFFLRRVGSYSPRSSHSSVASRQSWSNPSTGLPQVSSWRCKGGNLVSLAWLLVVLCNMWLGPGELQLDRGLGRGKIRGMGRSDYNVINSILAGSSWSRKGMVSRQFRRLLVTRIGN
ncbi:hypothetical protein F5X98DRAFT_27174 [Xylaria grammica]|nr:hypothetical protein F5X98DRAFT_27174 [Xylaria grammica]